MSTNDVVAVWGALIMANLLEMRGKKFLALFFLLIAVGLVLKRYFV